MRSGEGGRGGNLEVTRVSVLWLQERILQVTDLHRGNEVEATFRFFPGNVPQTLARSPQGQFCSCCKLQKRLSFPFAKAQRAAQREEVMACLEEEIRARLERAGQSHLLRFWGELDPAQRDSLLESLAKLDAEELGEHCRRAAEACAREEEPRQERQGCRIEPVPPEFFGSVCRSDPRTLEQWEEEGKARTDLAFGSPFDLWGLQVEEDEQAVGTLWVTVLTYRCGTSAQR